MTFLMVAGLVFLSAVIAASGGLLMGKITEYSIYDGDVPLIVWISVPAVVFIASASIVIVPIVLTL